MLKHRFVTGSVVVVQADPQQLDLRPGLYKILQALPAADTQLRYRVQNAADTCEWVVDEASISVGDKW